MHLMGVRHRFKRNRFSLIIAANTNNFVMATEISNQYGVDIENGYGPVIIDITVNTSVVVEAEGSSAAPALDLRGAAPGSVINLENKGWLLGAGGKGGAGSIGGDGAVGFQGGTAIIGPDEENTFNITNAAGRIFAGGGGGGGGGRANKFIDGPDEPVLARGGGGGGGAGIGSLGGAGGNNVDLGSSIPAQNGTAGTHGTGGAGGAGGNGGSVLGAVGGKGGAGGAYGVAGSAGNHGTGSSPGPNGLGGAGGAAGTAILHTGATINWISGNVPARVKGDVVDDS